MRKPTTKRQRFPVTDGHHQVFDHAIDVEEQSKEDGHRRAYTDRIAQYRDELQQVSGVESHIVWLI